jgi:hypothetical protein
MESFLLQSRGNDLGIRVLSAKGDVMSFHNVGPLRASLTRAAG